MQNHVFHITNLNPPTTDKCILSCIGDTVSAKAADIVSATDYSPFGAPLAGRVYSSNAYRFGFNGQERDDEVAGVGNTMTAEFWEYDARLGRRWNLDPLYKPFYSAYLVFSNNPIIMIDPNGDADYYNTKGKKIGSDGFSTDNSIIIVWNKDIESQILDASSKALFFLLPLQNADGTLRISEQLGFEMLEALKRSNSPNLTVGDEQGGWHEEGLVRGVFEGEEMIIPSKAGPLFNPETGAELFMWVPADVNQNGILNPENATLDFHIHVRGNSNELISGNVFSNASYPDQAPSRKNGDIEKYRPGIESMNPKIISSVLGAANGVFSLYNSLGVYAKFNNFIQILNNQHNNEKKTDIKLLDLGFGGTVN